MKIAYLVVLALGAKMCKIDEIIDDPQTEEEFKKLEYQSDTEITWQQYQDKYVEVERKYGLKFLRIVRNQLLRDTDWIMAVDNFNSLTNKEDWIAYRKALRDLPDNPPPFKWIGTKLDTDSMDMPKQPPILRESVD